jgi:hypothetical protein
LGISREAIMEFPLPAMAITEDMSESEESLLLESMADISELPALAKEESMPNQDPFLQSMSNPDTHEPERSRNEIQTQLVEMLLVRHTLSEESVFENDLQDNSIRSFFNQNFPQYAELPIQDLKKAFGSFRKASKEKKVQDDIVARKEANRKQIRETYLNFQAKQKAEGLKAAIIDHKHKHARSLRFQNPSSIPLETSVSPIQATLNQHELALTKLLHQNRRETRSVPGDVTTRRLMLSTLRSGDFLAGEERTRSQEVLRTTPQGLILMLMMLIVWRCHLRPWDCVMMPTKMPDLDLIDGEMVDQMRDLRTPKEKTLEWGSARLLLATRSTSNWTPMSLFHRWS